jgi:hypothetical protein
LTAVIDGIHASIDKAEAQGELSERHNAFSRLLMRNAMLHYEGMGLDAVSFSRLRALGLSPEVAPPSLPGNLADLLRSPSNPSRARVPAGPLLFVPENQTLAVIEVAPILLHCDQTLRSAAVTYLQSATLLQRPWLTTETRELLSKRQDDIQTKLEERWRDGAIDVVTAVRRDLFALIAAFGQSVACRYQEGIDQYLEAVMHPAFETLANLRPPLWSPSEQRDEIQKWITEIAALPDLGMALTQYLDRWGYVPLSTDLSAPKLVNSWLEQHPDSHVGWDGLWEWANKTATPQAKYHALTVAFHIPSMRPEESLEPFWEEVVAALDLHDGASNTWHVFCELASHFARHIEALHPCQHGERIACYAWWLADKVARLVGTDDGRAKHFKEKVLSPALQISYFRWTLSRSPVVPSSFRHATLHAISVWAISLLVHLSRTIKTFPAHCLPERLRPRISKVLQGYLLMSNPADTPETLTPSFALEENSGLEGLCTAEAVVSEDKRDALAQLIRFRRDLASPEQLQWRLHRLHELPIEEQYATLLVLNDALHVSAKCDGIVDAWLNQTEQVVVTLKQGPDFLLEPLLELLSEFQQRAMNSWAIRLPHLLAYVIEQTDDPLRVSLLSTAVLQMSLNGGVASAISRVVSSNKWPEWRASIATWHENLAEVAQHSEPWIAARIRGVSATISRLIGPRRTADRVTRISPAGSENDD